jgi:iron complex outermembrane receptor protein
MLSTGSARLLRTATFVASLLLSAAFTAPAFADIEVVVVTAEKRSQDVQTVPVAISVFGSDKRDKVGINSIQDMTNFTPGLEYSTSTDRISLRGVGRLTNVLSADASVANYDDGLYETFAVAAGRSSLDLDRVEVLRGPQGTLYGRNAIGGALNEITRRPTEDFQSEVRATYGNYDHYTLEAALSGPLGDGWLYKVYVNWDKQGIGYAKSLIPNNPSEYQHYDDWYADGQIQTSFFGGAIDMWTKFQSAQWMHGAGNAGAQSSGWNKFDAPTYEWGNASTELNPNYGCSAAGAAYSAASGGGVTSALSPTSPLPLNGTACQNPEFSTPWKINRVVPYDVHLPEYFSVDSQWTWHTGHDFDVKDIVGGTFYRYILTGATENAGANSAARGAVTGYNIASAFGGAFGHSFVESGNSQFNYQEHNGFISNEVDLISTGDSPLQWVAGVYYFQQHYSQPVWASNPNQPEYEQALGAPGALCAQTGGVCAPVVGSRWFDNRPRMHANSEAVYGQVDYKWSDELKFTGGLRYSGDRKYGVESVRLLCFGVPACYSKPEIFSPQAVDLTQLGTVVASGLPGPLPKGVTGLTTYDTTTGLASRPYHASWGALTGTAKIEWTPDDTTLIYGSYSKGYKSGGFNIGIFTVLSFQPYTNSEKVDSFEIGAKKSFGDWLVLDAAVFHYAYKNLQIPLTTVQSAGGLTQAETNFFNVPGSISQGAELETIVSPIENLNILFNYSYLDAHISTGMAPDPADPNATDPRALPALTDAQCAASALTASPQCTSDIYTKLLANGAAGAGCGFTVTGGAGCGWNKPQFLHGNILPNSPKNKIAINVQYTWKFDIGSFTPSISYVWRGAQYGTLFTRSYNRAPAWDQWDTRLVFTSDDDKWEAILFGKNVFNKIGYDGGATGYRLAGCIDAPYNGVTSFGQTTCFVQGVNNPAGYGRVRGENATGQVSTYSVTPPATWGLEVHYKF